MDGQCSQSLGAGGTNFFLGFVQTMIAAQCSLDPALQYPNIYTNALKDGEEFDYIVVGAGSAGSIVASRLAENQNMKVLLLEAGGIPSVTTEIPYLMRNLIFSIEDWSYISEPGNICLSTLRCIYSRGKVLGGSGSINGMLYLRGNRRDYAEWSKHNSGWSYDNVIKYFRKLENVKNNKLHKTYGSNGKLPLNSIPAKHPIRNVIIAAAKELGMNHNEIEVPIGYFDTLLNIDEGLRVSSAKAYLTKTHRTNLHIAIGVQVGSVIFSTIKGNKIATGVNVRIGYNLLRLKATREVIISAGSINSPQILMNSGIGPKAHLQSLGIKLVKDLQVGENLQDHFLYVGHAAELPKELVYPYDDTEEKFKFLQHREGLYSSMDLNSLMGFIDTLKNSSYPDIQIQHRVDRSTGKPALNFMLMLLKPRSRGRILLKSNDPFDQPRIFINSLSKDEDVATLLRGVKYTEKIMNTSNFKKFKLDFKRVDVPACNNFTGDAFHECAMRYTGYPVFHMAGTCKMGPSSDKNAVVDSKLRVHGVKNLRVVDASIMPSVVSCNINGPTMMIAEKGADFIKETWKL